MQWVEQHLTKHHLFHAPHKWFWAVILAPIHAGEIHYKHRYSLTFIHAKKLFFFDMALLCSIGVLTSSIFVWFTYDPTVLNDVTLSIDATTERIPAGQLVRYTVHYKNDSEKTLEETVLSLALPESFVIQQTTPEDTFAKDSHTFTLPSLPNGAGGSVHIDGWFYGSPEQDHHIIATFSYRAKDRTVREQKQVRILATLRGSLIETEVTMPDTILAEGSTPFTILLTNYAEGGAHSIHVPLSFGDGFSIDTQSSVSLGTLSSASWDIPTSTFATATLSGVLHSNVAASLQSKEIQITPHITIAGKTYEQVPVKKTVAISHPKLTTSVTWKQTPLVSETGKTIDGTITLKNNGSTTLEDIIIRIPLSSIIDQAELKKRNTITLEKDTAIFSPTKHASLLSLPAGEETSIDIHIPIKKIITTGEHIELSITPTITAAVSRIPQSSFRSTAQSEKIKIASSLSLHGELRYFTADGDQLGRGPLPPRVGKETKYWTFIHLLNYTNDISNVSVSATLPPGISWTGKSSVSHGKDAIYQELTRTITWKTPEMAAHSEAGIYLELAITPEAADIGKTPPFLTNLRASATDDFTGTPLLATSPSLDLSLPTDQEARSLGTKIQP